MTKYDDQVEVRCPQCGILVRLTDDKCPKCETMLAYGYNIKKDRQNLSYKYKNLPRWVRACCLASVLALFVYSIIAKSGICLLLSIVLFDLLLILGKRLLLSFFMPFSSHPYFYVEQEPWDKTIYDPYAGKKAIEKN